MVVHTVISALGRGRQEDQKFKFIDYGAFENSQVCETLSLKKTCQQRKTSKKVFLFLHDVLCVVLYRWKRLGFPIYRTRTEICSCCRHPEEHREGRKPESPKAQPSGTPVRSC